MLMRDINCEYSVNVLASENIRKNCIILDSSMTQLGNYLRLHICINM